MAYRTSISPRAKWDLEGIYGQIRAARSPLALAWYRGLKQDMQKLNENLERCALTPEDRGFWHLLYGRSNDIFRVIFRTLLNRNLLEIVHIRHGAQQPFTASDLN